MHLISGARGRETDCWKRLSDFYKGQQGALVVCKELSEAGTGAVTLLDNTLAWFSSPTEITVVRGGGGTTEPPRLPHKAPRVEGLEKQGKERTGNTWVGGRLPHPHLGGMGPTSHELHWRRWVRAGELKQKATVSQGGVARARPEAMRACCTNTNGFMRRC